MGLLRFLGNLAGLANTILKEYFSPARKRERLRQRKRKEIEELRREIEEKDDEKTSRILGRFRDPD